MAPTITLSETLFSRLQSLATPFIDTPETVISRLLDAYDVKAGPDATATTTFRAFNPAAAPNLAFTKIVSAVIDGELVDKKDNYWNKILLNLIKQAHNRGVVKSQLRKLISVNSKDGRKEDEGYRYIPEADISVQLQDANAAWRAIYNVIEAMGFGLVVKFSWYDNPKAQHPGESGSFAIGPQK